MTNKILEKREPKYSSIKRSLVERIARGIYSATKAVPPERDLGLELGASPMTVRRAIQELVDEGVLNRQRGRGKGTFVIDTPHVAKAVRPNGSKMKRVGIIHLYDWDMLRKEPVFFLTFLELQSACAKRGVTLEFLPQPNPPSGGGRPLAQRVADSKCDALIVFDWPDSDELVATQNAGVPVIVAGLFQETVPLSYVAPNDFQGAYAVNRLLLDLGHKEIAMVTDRKFAKVSSDREAGWCTALERLAEDAAPLLYRIGRRRKGEGQSFPEVRAELVAEFRRRPPPSAVFARDGFFAFAAIQALKELGRSCPKDVSVACVGSFFEGTLDMPHMTTARIQDGVLGEEVVRLADELVSGARSSPAGIVLPMRVVQGETTRTRE
jgi:DNA-binding LacI/PurR family transcriptional regulator